ncbi:MAG: hypothetical protein Ct9H90mP10_09250 [Actinomycetota bacterium]|nr:MAG: hypothetical protein Ct9H90mP10_09250 [Actinomycetota bacterium]
MTYLTNYRKILITTKTQYETVEDYRNFIEDELSLILSDNLKKQILQTIEVNDNLEIISSLESLYNKNFELDKNNFMNLARMGSLSFIDQSWKNHLSEMDYLRSGIGLRAMGQRDPLVEYQKEGYDLFEDLIHNVKLSVVRLLLNFDKISQQNNDLDKEKKKKHQMLIIKIKLEEMIHVLRVVGLNIKNAE